MSWLNKLRGVLDAAPSHTSVSSIEEFMAVSVALLKGRDEQLIAADELAKYCRRAVDAMNLANKTFKIEPAPLHNDLERAIVNYENLRGMK